MNLYEVLKVVDVIQPIHLWNEKKKLDDNQDHFLDRTFPNKMSISPKYYPYEVIYIGTDLDSEYLFIELGRKGIVYGDNGCSSS